MPIRQPGNDSWLPPSFRSQISTVTLSSKVMVIPLTRALLATTSLALAITTLPAQDTSQDLRREEQFDYFERWLKEDAVYIIMPEERTVFDSLTTDEEKERFVEQFWRRRDTDFSTGLNESKEEHYRRIAYANEEFHWGKPGWQTDRGRVYIMFGEPDRRERFEAGSTYRRTALEGGGHTVTYPYEVWFYRHLPGVGAGVVVEFVDSGLTGEFALAMRPEEKDALFFTGQGRTLMEEAGLETRAGRLRARDVMRPVGLDGDSVHLKNPFDLVRQYFQLTHRRYQIKNPELEELVRLKVTYQSLPFSHVVHANWIAEDLHLASVTLSIPNQELDFQPFGQDLVRARLVLYGQVDDVAGLTVFSFEDEITTDISPLREARELGRHSVYQKKIPLKTGRYKLTLVLKDTTSERIGVLSRGLVAAAKKDSLGASSLILCEHVRFTGQQGDLTQPFVYFGGVKLYPSTDNVFQAGAALNAYLEIYNPALDQSTGKPNVTLEYAVLEDGAPAPQFIDITGRAGAVYGNRIVILDQVPLHNLSPGRYAMQIRYTDRINGQVLSRSARFQLRDKAL